MKRDYHKWFSPALRREMEMLVFGHGGVPVVVFPSSCGRFYEFEDRGLVGVLGQKIERGEVQLFCVDSVDAESWYNRSATPRRRVERQIEYERYVMNEVLPLLRGENGGGELVTAGCSFGGYHAVNFALRHPEVFTGFLSMSGAFDLRNFLGGYRDEDCYLNLPIEYVGGMRDGETDARYRGKTYVLATGEHDQCWNQNERLAGVMRGARIPVRLEVWGDGTRHDWPYWKKMVEAYL